MSKSAKQLTNVKVDGRIRRSERSRQAILDAMLVLINDGNLVPTAQQVSECAGVGIRTVFRQFSDMESLFAALDMQMRDAYEAMFIGGNRKGSITDRIRHAIERHAEGFEQNKKLIKSSGAQIWKSETLQKNYDRNQKGLRRDLDDWLPELSKLSKRRREAIDLVASPEAWNRLREHQGLSKTSAIEVVVDGLTLLMKE